MAKPETDDERRSRELRELEGKNVAYYSVVLQTVIKSELEGIRQIIALSSVGIGLQFALDRLPSGTGLLWIGVIFSIVSVLGFAAAVLCGIVFLLRASKRYEQELRGAGSLPEYQNLLKARTMFTRWKCASIVAFVVGVLSLGAFVAANGMGALRGQSKEPAHPKTTSVAPGAAQPMSMRVHTSQAVAPAHQARAVALATGRRLESSRPDSTGLAGRIEQVSRRTGEQREGKILLMVCTTEEMTPRIWEFL